MPELTGERSLYLQIAALIETDILRDILREEERVPSTNELAKLYATVFTGDNEVTKFSTVISLRILENRLNDNIRIS